MTIARKFFGASTAKSRGRSLLPSTAQALQKSQKVHSTMLCSTTWRGNTVVYEETTSVEAVIISPSWKAQESHWNMVLTNKISWLLDRVTFIRVTKHETKRFSGKASCCYNQEPCFPWSLQSWRSRAINIGCTAFQAPHSKKETFKTH